MIESRGVFRRRRFHRAKAHLILSAMRHRAAELGDRVRYVKADTYRQGLREAVGEGRVTVHHPTSHAADAFVRSLPSVRVLPARGFLVTHDEFRTWADGRGTKHLRQEDFYRWVRGTHDLLMEGDGPAGGRWNLDHDNRQPPPRGSADLGVPAPYHPGRARSTTRCGPTSTGGRATGTSGSSARTRPAASPPPAGRHSPDSAGSWSTGSPRSARTRTRCSPGTRR